MTHKHGKNPFGKEEDSKIEVVDAEADDAEVSAENAENSNTDDNKLQEEYDKLNQQYIRLAADFDNFRKRQAQERENLLRFGTENALKNLIEVVDNFERGAKALENVDDAQKIKESFNLLHNQTLEVLRRMGLEEIEADGKEFDPNFHEAVMQTPTSDYAENSVISVMQKGYKAGDKVLRPALVNVATAP